MTKGAISLTLLGLALGCDGASTDQPAIVATIATRPATRSATLPADALNGEQLDYARRPITYFNEKCGKCHGNYGTYWLEGTIAGLGEQKLREEVELMAAGPSRAPLEALALDVQVAYHRSLADGRPFVTVFRDESGLAGEVAPGSRVFLVIDGHEQEAQVQEHRWRSSLRDATALRVVKQEAFTELPLTELKEADTAVLHSHNSPRN